MTRLSNITVIIPVLKNWEYTYKCLQSLMINSTLVDEIIIIDNERDATTASAIADLGYQHISLYIPRRNLGVSKSWDTGIKLAKNNIVAVLNNDIEIITSEWDRKLFEEWSKYPQAAIFCPWPIGRAEEAKETNAEAYSGLNGSFFVLDKKCIELTDNFKTKGEYIDTAYTPAYWEDADLLVQVRKLGLNSFVTPKVYAIHYGNKTAGPLLPSHKGMDNPYWKNLDYFNKKYNVYIWDCFEVYLSNVQDENTHRRLV